MATLQTITVQQPWAWAIAAGYKPIENRSRPDWAPGEDLALHAGKRWSTRGAHDPRVIDAVLLDSASEVGGTYRDLDYLRLDLGRRGIPRLPAHRFVPGAVLAVARLVDNHRDEAGCCRPWGESLYAEAGGQVRSQVWHLVLADVRRLPNPVPVDGQLGRWYLPKEINRAVLDQLASLPT